MSLHIQTPLIESRPLADRRPLGLAQARSPAAVRLIQAAWRWPCLPGPSCPRCAPLRLVLRWQRGVGCGLCRAQARRAGDRGGARNHHRTRQGAAARKTPRSWCTAAPAGGQRTGADIGRARRCLHPPVRRSTVVGRSCQHDRRSRPRRHEARCRGALGGWRRPAKWRGRRTRTQRLARRAGAGGGNRRCGLVACSP